MEYDSFEERWYEEKVKSVNETVSFIKKTPAILKKYKFEKLYTDIIQKLLKSNNKLWYDIDEATMKGRERKTVIQDIEETVLTLTNKINEERKKDSPNMELVDFLRGELEYIGEHFDPDTNTLITYVEVNKNYGNMELISYFVETAEKIDVLLENTMDKEGLLTKEKLFAEYFAHLFAYHINDCLVEITDTEIKVKFLVPEELNENN